MADGGHGDRGAAAGVRVRAVASAFPEHVATREAITDAVLAIWRGAGPSPAAVARLHRSAGVERRHTILPLGRYGSLGGLKERNAIWLEAACALGERAASEALRSAGLAPADLDHVLFVSTTGLSTPSVDARLADRMSMRPDVKRSPLFGLGCAGGVGALGRAADFLRGQPPGARALVVAVELCTLTFRREDTSAANVIATALFGDGAAAAILERGGEGGPELVDARTVLVPGTADLVGWDVVDGGFKLLLGVELPAVVERRVPGAVDDLLRAHAVARRDVRHWIVHAGGPKVLDALARALALAPGALAPARASLRRIGNVSSASALCLLEEVLAGGEARPGDLGVALAAGPGAALELALLRW